MTTISSTPFLAPTPQPEGIIVSFSSFIGVTAALVVVVLMFIASLIGIVVLAVLLRGRHQSYSTKGA